jgi:hypothetical protein
MFRKRFKAFLPKRLLMEYHLHDELKHGEPELQLAGALCSLDEFAVDVGANLGVYAYLFSKFTRHVIALEANPSLCKELRTSLPKSIEVINLAASDSEGSCEFYIPESDGQEIHTRGSLEQGINGS